ncbi:DEAD/DEAH box helicase family protein [Candidatus Riflebacteria bacterium]
MPSNLVFLQKEWPEFFEPGLEAEKAVFTAPRTSAFYSRYTMEKAVKWLYKIDSYLRKPYQDNLAGLIHEQTFKDNLPPGMFGKINFLRKIGNIASHSDTGPGASESLMAFKYLHTFLAWLATYYGNREGKIPPVKEDLIPREGAADQNAGALRELEETLKSKDRQLEEKEEKLAKSEEEIKQLLEEIQQIKTQNRAAAYDVALTEDATEEETRIYIDLLLREAGWDPDKPNVREFEVQGMPADTGIGYADYVLWGDDGLPLAVVEAKRSRKSAAEGAHQAELYADCLEKMTGQRPIIFYTNGFEIWLWDNKFYPPRKIYGFYTKDELQLLIHRRKTRKELKNEKINEQIAGRYYQQEAIRRVTEALTKGARKSLLVMATGSGKTRVSIAIVELLTKANWVRRVLFLADRTALVNQAMKAFKENAPNLSIEKLSKKLDHDKSRVIFSTYPSMMNSIDDARTDGVKTFSPGHFDLIIIDEAHRSVYKKYQAIFDYFDGILLGLTATPKSDVDINTYRLFQLENYMPHYAYELDQAVADGFLVPYKSHSVPIKFQREGIRYDDLSEEEKEEFEATFIDEESGQLPLFIRPEALNKWLFNSDTVDKVLGFLMERGIKVESGDRIGKTIIFARNHKHAEFIKERFDIQFPQYKGHFCRIIDHQVNYAQSLIDNFSQKESEPHIAISVDMLDTGIDILEILNLVFFKVVRSKVKFQQMIGRGTRLCPDLFAPNNDKMHFYIFDFCENFEFFNEKPEGIETDLQENLSQKIFKRRLALSQLLRQAEWYREEENQELFNELLDTLHSQVAGLDSTSFTVRKHKLQVDTYKNREKWNDLNADNIKDIEEHLSNLYVAYGISSEEEFARRFDLTMLNTQIAFVQGHKSYKKYRKDLVKIAEDLSKKSNIPDIARSLELILEMQKEEFWALITVVKLEQVREQLRTLIKFLDKDKTRKIVYTHFEDAFLTGPIIDYGVGTATTDFINYKKKVERYIEENQNHPSIQKLKNNQPITQEDLDALELILFEGDLGTKDDFIKEFGTDKPLGDFIRGFVGLDRSAAKEAFSVFLDKGTLSADQITFINQIINYLTKNGTMDAESLFEAPFTDINSEGVSGVFDIKDSKLILSIIEKINRATTPGTFN